MGGLGRVAPQLLESFARALRMDGSAETYRNFMSFEAWPVMIMLALAGALLIGNDVRHNSMAFYLSKPISRWDYVIGKGIAVAFVINFITTAPALVLWLEYGFIKQNEHFFDQFVEKADLLVGILAYGAVLTVSLTSLLLAAATWLRRTVPLIMAWVILFIFCASLGNALTALGWGAGWRLFDLWNCTYVVGNACLGIESSRIVPQPQPEWEEAALVLTGVVVACLSYLVWRIRGVEVVR
jgi:ABC-type transport system involved in multi-copper enzyme maturation permease subunit